jgi:hypothetical protein
MRRALAGTLLLLLACTAGRKKPEPEPEPALPRAAPLELPAEWDTMPLLDFERWVVAALPEDVATPIPAEGLQVLGAALGEPPRASGGGLDPRPVRAAVILGRSRHPASSTPLIRRLEQRELGPERWSDCGDTLAAAALARFPEPRRYAQRLVPLVVGPRPHPDLEVRVECAATALHAGFTEVIPFLLQVLRIDTRAGQADRRDFAVSPTTAWARGRAAQALAAHAGIASPYPVDGSIEDREAAVRTLQALVERPPARPE